MDHRLFRIISALVVTLALLIPSGSVAAKGDNPTCHLAASPQSGSIPLTVHFQIVTSSKNDAMITYGDYKHADAASEKDHVYDQPGIFIARGIVQNYPVPIVCQVIIDAQPQTTTVNSPSNFPPKGTDTPMPASGSTNNSNNTSGTITGNDDIAPVVKGDGNTFNITVNQPQPTQPAPVINITNVIPTASATPVPVTTPTAPANKNGWDVLYVLVQWLSGH